MVTSRRPAYPAQLPGSEGSREGWYGVANIHTADCRAQGRHTGNVRQTGCIFVLATIQGQQAEEKYVSEAFRMYNASEEGSSWNRNKTVGE